MATNVSSETLTKLCEILVEERKASPRGEGLTRFEREVLKEGVAKNLDIGDYLITTETRALAIIEYIFEDLLMPFGIAQQSVGRRPVDPEDDITLTQALTAFDATALIIGLERLGLQVDPSRLVRELTKALEGREVLTSNELEIVLYDHYAGRRRTVLNAAQGPIHPMWTETTHQDEAGYRFTMKWDGDVVVWLEVLGPRYRKPEPQEHTVCEYCGHSYYTNNSQETRIHSEVHSRKKQMIDPQPDEQFAERLTNLGRAGELVDQDSPFWMHGAVCDRAFEFKREFKYDFVKWDGSSTRRAGEDWQGWLFAAYDMGTIAGACGFMRRDGAVEGPEWSLQWIWVAPKYRRAGLLEARWPSFLQAYGDFDIERPLSPAMQAFVRKHGTQSQKAALPPE
ncbi:GNAT family N-acetyltransferase [Pseudomonas putida]|uniref:GNAT family N-acetyltransferase n=1 Tax=Pseudomonas putida TaxID=303 RepID=UPI0018AC5C07|nr:GNAT family N-acetyltransferase [Pseudomonas putida]MBF8765826.1 GNAT family N-acetyltransferase [Pseudomonas putida]